MGKVHAQLFALDSGTGEGDREADTGVQEQVIVCVVAEVTPEKIGIEAKLAGDSFGYADFIEVSRRRPYGEPEDGLSDGIKLRRTGQQKILYSRSLKHA